MNDVFDRYETSREQLDSATDALEKLRVKLGTQSAGASSEKSSEVASPSIQEKIKQVVEEAREKQEAPIDKP